MTTKIEITITENDDVIFVYMYKEQTLIKKFQVAKSLIPLKGKHFTKNVCDAIGSNLARIIKSILEGSA